MCLLFLQLHLSLSCVESLPCVLHLILPLYSVSFSSSLTPLLLTQLHPLLHHLASPNLTCSFFISFSHALPLSFHLFFPVTTSSLSLLFFFRFNQKRINHSIFFYIENGSRMIITHTNPIYLAIFV